MAEDGDEKSPVIKIKSITIDSPITVCREQTPVETPNWKPGIYLNDGPGSKRPGVFEISEIANTQSEISGLPDMSEILECIDEFKENKRLQRCELVKPSENQSHQRGASGDGCKKGSKLIVTVTVKNPDAFEKAILVGELGEMIFIGKITVDGTSSPERQVNVVPLNEPSSFRRIWGDMGWYLVYDKGKKQVWIERLEETRLEIFWIYGYPGKMYKRGVWVEVLRLLDMECFGLEEKEWLIRRIVNYCHSGKGLRYDSYTFSSYYGLLNNGGAFNLESYLLKAFPFCNCYDQAGAVQTLLGALGIEVDWVFMAPFGYLKETILVGRGWCNNPGFMGLQLPEVYPTNQPDRSSFGCHAFCIWENGIYDIVLDACAGPQFGSHVKKSFITGFKQSYIETSIDGLTVLYGQGNSPEQPGRLQDMDKNYQGVIDIHAITDSPFAEQLYLSPRELERIKEFKERVDFDSAGQDILLDSGLYIHWSSDIDLWEELYKIPWLRTLDDTRIGIDIAVRQWSFIGENESINIEIYAANNSESAKNHLILLALSSTMHKIPFEKKPPSRQLGHLSVYSHSHYYKIEKWWYYNVCIKVVAYNASIDPETLTRKLQEELEDPKWVKNLSDFLPAIAEVKITPPDILIDAGKKVNIKVYPASNPNVEQNFLILEFFLNGDSLRFVKESVQENKQSKKVFELTFEAISPGAAGISLVLANRETLLCSEPWSATLNIIENNSSGGNRQ